MRIAIVSFLLLTVLYHILVTVVAHGIFDSSTIQWYISILRDILWVFITIWAVIKYRKDFRSYFKKYQRWWIIFFGLTVFSLGISYVMGQSFIDMLIGYKYSFYYLFIFLSATVIGYLGIKENPSSYIKKWILALFAVVSIGYLWQGAKLLLPDFFLNIGYGPLNDFVYQMKPPIYYLTGFNGITRRQGVFSGPNNYGYFLLAFFPVIYYYTIKFPKNLIKNKFIRDIIILVVWGVTLGFTLSRAAFLGMGVVLILINFQTIKKNKKLAIGAGILFVGAIVALSILKYKSTLAHISHKLEWIETVIHKPLGYGLGTSWPSIHHGWTQLPENYFVQILIDVGTVGFLLRSVFMFWMLKLFATIKKSYLVSTTKRLLTYNIWLALFSGYLILLFTGLFLHVFEDSMVNYLLFIPLGILTWYLSQEHIDDSFE